MTSREMPPGISTGRPLTFRPTPVEASKVSQTLPLETICRVAPAGISWLNNILPVPVPARTVTRLPVPGEPCICSTSAACVAPVGRPAIENPVAGAVVVAAAGELAAGAVAGAVVIGDGRSR